MFWRLSVNQPPRLTKAAEASPSRVYKLITAISTAAPNKPKCCSKREPSKKKKKIELSAGSKFRQKPSISKLWLLISDNKTGKQAKQFRQFLPDNPSLMSTACKMEGTINFQLPLWSVCSEAKVQEEIWSLLNFSQSKSKAGRASPPLNVQELQSQALSWDNDSNRSFFHLSWTMCLYKNLQEC